MNTNQLKRFAKEARIKLLEQVGRKLEYVLSNSSQIFLDTYSIQLSSLQNKINQTSKEQVIEMVAYTWFNRLMALRFMDANGYTLPKVVTPLPSMSNPEILQNALGGNIEPELKIDRQRLNDLLDGKTAATDAHTEAYKMLLVASCNQWHTAMPFMFERISDYTELLLPDDLLSDYSIVADIRNGMNDEDCLQEELIGWLYQFYITDKKDEVFNGLKKNIKITAENIPAATQLFTPHWIVRYMVENTLGKLWLTFKPKSKLREYMLYYIEEPEGNAPAPMPDGITSVTDITFLDPCQGSGHVLVYAFDLFTKIYEEEGYNTNEIPALILQHNLFGIDIDERAAQLAAFALTMKARSYYSRFLRKPVLPNVIALENVSEETIRQTIKLPLMVNGKKIEKHSDMCLHYFTQADNFGSLIQIDPEEYKAIQILEGSIWQEKQEKLKEQAQYLSCQYHCVVTNPPYMGQKGMNDSLKLFVEENYPKSKIDLMACFIEACINFTIKNGFISIINQHVWMFNSSYESLRQYLIENFCLVNLLHLGPHTFPEIGGEIVQNASFVFSKSMSIDNSVFLRLTDINSSEVKNEQFLINKNGGDRYFINHLTLFKDLPGTSFAYWLNEIAAEAFKDLPPLGDVFELKKGMDTGENEIFIRYWHEVDFNKVKFNLISGSETFQGVKWVPYRKGGPARKWYGNNDFVINWENDGELVKGFPKSNIRNKSFYFKPALSWSLTGSDFAVRYYPEGFVFDANGSSLFSDEHIYNILAFLNSGIAPFYLSAINPSLAFQKGDLEKIPFEKKILIDSNLEELSNNCIRISKQDWDSHEAAYDFKKNPFINEGIFSLKKALSDYKDLWSKKIEELLIAQNKINLIICNFYGLNNYSIGTTMKDISFVQNEAIKITQIDPLKIDVNFNVWVENLISYSVGVLFGRFSIISEGIQKAITLKSLNQELVDQDNIIPILEGEWFTDDIVGRFKVFLKAAFGDEHFEENLKYIEDTIGKDIRKYFVKDFYNDHIKRYKKRPIYWMFSSPKGHFKALIYMHRYQPDLCSKLLNDYLQAFISKLEAAKQSQTMFSLREDISAREKTIALKEIDNLEAMIKDCKTYEKTLFIIATQKISIDLDDGVKVNYQKFKEVLVPIKGLEKEEE